jgi:dUTP pyrophosphatase
MWREFADAVEAHIRDYTIPQYGDWPDDQMSTFTDEDITTSIQRYENRRGKGARGIAEEMRDCLKIAHYWQCLEVRGGPRVKLWRDYASLIAGYLYRGDSLIGTPANACEHWHKLKAQTHLGVVEQISGEQIVPIHRSSPHALMPEYKSDGASGFDLAASEPVTIWPWRRKTVSTGWRMEIPDGFEVQIRPRSGLALKGVFLMPNSPGTIDSDYRGDVKVIFLNASLCPVRIKQGDRIAQGILAPVIRACFKETDDLSETVRGASGFGSTGV